MLPDLILSGLTLNASSLPVNDTSLLAGVYELVVSFVISIDESFLGESI